MTDVDRRDEMADVGRVERAAEHCETFGHEASLWAAGATHLVGGSREGQEGR